MKAAAVVQLFTGNGAAARVAKFEARLAASDTRLARLNERLEETAAAFEENADVSALKAAESALAAETAERAALARGLEKAREDDAAEQKARADEAEAERQKALISRAEKLDGEMRDAFRHFIECAEKSVEVVSQISDGKGTRFDIAFIMGEVAQEAAKGAGNVLFIRLPLGFSLRLPPASPKLAALAAEQRAFVAEHQERVADWLAADAARAAEAAARPGRGYQKAAEIAARRMPSARS